MVLLHFNIYFAQSNTYCAENIHFIFFAFNSDRLIFTDLQNYVQKK